MINLCEFRKRKTLGAPSLTLLGQRWDLGPLAMDAHRDAPNRDPFAFLSKIADEDYRMPSTRHAGFP